MQVARGLLADITATAGSLKTAIEDTSTRVAQMASISGLTGSIMRWSWMSLVVFVLYQFNPRIAGYLTAAFGKFTRLKASRPKSLMLSHRRFPSVNNIRHLREDRVFVT